MKPSDRLLLLLGALVGSFASAGDLAAQCSQIVPFGPASSPLGASPLARVQPLPNDRVLGIGVTLAGGQAWPGLAEFDGGTWSTFAFPLAGLAPNVTAVRPNGDLLVGGVPSGGAPSPVAIRQGGAWSFLGSLSPVSWIQSLLPLPNGDVVAGGWFVAGNRLMVARWDGSAWQPMGAGFDEEVRALVAMPDGSVVAGGWFAASGSTLLNRVARWNGSSWQALGSGFAPDLGVVEALCVMPNGDLIAGGTFTSASGGPASRIARWDGTAWRALGSGVNGGVASLSLLPDGDLLVTGAFTMAGGVPASGVARWNGLAWSSVGVAPSVFGPSVCRLRDDFFVLAGDFGAGEGLVGITTACPASAQVAGPGCAGHQLTVDRPWTGAPVHANATGLPNASIVGLVYGHALASASLASLFATALPGCDLHVQPDVVELGFAAGGQFASSFLVPDLPALAGVPFHHQVLSLALDPSLAVAATNAVSLTVGVF